MLPDVPTGETVIEQFRDYATIRWTRGDYAIHFDCYEVVGWPADGDGSLFYERKGAVEGTDTVESLGEAQKLLEADVKWDGCSHFDFGADGYIHLCGLHAISDLADLMRHMAEIAARYFPEARSTLPESLPSQSSNA